MRDCRAASWLVCVMLVPGIRNTAALVECETASTTPRHFIHFLATNKGILSILHIAENAFHSYVVQAGVFAGILRAFNDANNLMTSSILTLLHTILQVRHARNEFLRSNSICSL